MWIRYTMQISLGLHHTDSKSPHEKGMPVLMVAKLAIVGMPAWRGYVLYSRAVIVRNIAVRKSQTQFPDALTWSI